MWTRPQTTYIVFFINICFNSCSVGDHYTRFKRKLLKTSKNNELFAKDFNFFSSGAWLRQQTWGTTRHVPHLHSFFRGIIFYKNVRLKTAKKLRKMLKTYSRPRKEKKFYFRYCKKIMEILVFSSNDRL